MPGRPTDHRNLDLTKFNLDVLRRRAGGKVIWQPRIGCWMGDKLFAGQSLPAPYTGMTLDQIYRCLGVSNRIYDFNACFGGKEPESVRRVERRLSEWEYEAVTETPAGKQRAVYRRSPNNFWHMPVKWPVADAAEMKVAAWRARHVQWSWSQPKYEELSKTWAGLGAPSMWMPRVNVQRLYLDDMGVENAVFAMTDYPAVCEEYFEAHEESVGRLIDVINASPIEVINFGDNVHAGTLGVEPFKKHVLPVYRKRCEKLHRAGKFVHAHWDGDTGPLLPYARETGLDGIEAITPEPQGDVTLEEVHKHLGDMFMLDGIPAIYFDKRYPESLVVETARRCIDLLAPNLVLGISDEISSTGEIERVRLVTEVVDEYNAARV